jgi:hypothetical protein
VGNTSFLSQDSSLYFSPSLYKGDIMDVKELTYTFTFTFTENEMAIIMTGLGELPARVSNDLINRLNKEGAEIKEKISNDSD